MIKESKIYNFCTIKCLGVKNIRAVLYNNIVSRIRIKIILFR